MTFPAAGDDERAPVHALNISRGSHAGAAEIPVRRGRIPADSYASRSSLPLLFPPLSSFIVPVLIFDFILGIIAVKVVAPLAALDAVVPHAAVAVVIPRAAI